MLKLAIKLNDQLSAKVPVPNVINRSHKFNTIPDLLIQSVP